MYGAKFTTIPLSFSNFLHNRDFNFPSRVSPAVRAAAGAVRWSPPAGYGHGSRAGPGGTLRYAGDAAGRARPDRPAGRAIMSELGGPWPGPGGPVAGTQAHIGVNRGPSLARRSEGAARPGRPRGFTSD
eukprot:218437-Hanusia_phi.AAC.2